MRERATEQAAVLAELHGLGVPVRTVAHCAAEPVGVGALRELGAGMWGDDDPAAEAGPGVPLLTVRRTGGDGRSAESEFELALHLPGAAAGALDLVRIGDDELAVTAAGVRRVVALPAALRRCTLTGARLDGDDLRVAFRPDPALWMR
jgi:arsenite-transporting ATPase